MLYNVLVLGSAVNMIGFILYSVLVPGSVVHKRGLVCYGKLCFQFF